jgi:7-carboxy-7-deazaguanine synthase
MSLDEVIDVLRDYPTTLVEVTGGEPLEQEDVYVLMDTLLARGYTVMLETGGHVSIDRVPREVIKIVDVKCPDSRESDKNHWPNVDLAHPHDEFKFVIASRPDYEWARDVFRSKLQHKPNVTLFSPAHDEVKPVDLAGWILEDGLPVRMQLQIHKYIWGAHTRGV